MNFKRAKNIIFPENMLLDANNSKKTIKHIVKITRYSNRTLYLDFSKIQYINKSVLIIILAQIEKTKAKRKNTVYRKSGFPQKKSIRKLFTTIEEVLHRNQNIESKHIELRQKSHLLETEALNYATKLTRKIGVKEFQDDLYVVIQEIMANAVEHGIKKNKINWWMTHEVSNKDKKLRYTFLDMGDGISKSYKASGIPIKYLILDNRRVIIDALFGTLGSSTKKPERGNGLPQIRNYVELEYLSDFHLITNTVSLRYENEQFIIDKNRNFYGTFFTWTVTKDNILKWKN